MKMTPLSQGFEVRELCNPRLDRTSTRVVQVALEVDRQKHVLNHVFGSSPITENFPGDRKYKAPVAGEEEIKTSVAASLRAPD
jgi:hypothetical protein